MSERERPQLTCMRTSKAAGVDKKFQQKKLLLSFFRRLKIRNDRQQPQDKQKAFVTGQSIPKIRPEFCPFCPSEVRVFLDARARNIGVSLLTRRRRDNVIPIQNLDGRDPIFILFFPWCMRARGISVSGAPGLPSSPRSSLNKKHTSCMYV